MSTKTIPAQVIKTCDGCGVTIDPQNSRQEGKLTLNVNALDMHGHACADATRKLDLCDSCLYKVGKAIDAAMAPPTSAEGCDMQYILTQAEYDDLRRAQGVLTTAKKSELQRLCTDAANHIPITRGWAPNDPPAPWGCILDESSPNHRGYCDACPAHRICPHDNKDWSQ